MADSALQAKGNAIYVDTTQDWSTTPAIGKLINFSAGVPALITSNTAAPVGVILDARTRNVMGVNTYMNSWGVLGELPGPCRGLIDTGSAVLYPGDRVMMTATGTLTKEVTGSARWVVGVATDVNGAQPGDLAEITFITPSYLTY